MRLEHPGADEARVAHRAEHGQEPLDALLRGGARRGLLEARGRLLRRVACVGRAREAGEPVHFGDEARRARRRADGVDERRALEAARDRLGDAPPVGHANGRQGLGELHVLTELAAGEARAPPLGHAKVELRLALACLGEHVASEREKLRPLHDDLGHAPVPVPALRLMTSSRP